MTDRHVTYLPQNTPGRKVIVKPTELIPYNITPETPMAGAGNHNVHLNSELSLFHVDDQTREGGNQP
jgi:hypothetical protein